MVSAACARDVLAGSLKSLQRPASWSCKPGAARARLCPPAHATTPAPSLQTEHYIVLCVWPLLFDLPRLAVMGAPAAAMKWSPERGALWHVIDKRSKGHVATYKWAGGRGGAKSFVSGSARPAMCAAVKKPDGRRASLWARQSGPQTSLVPVRCHAWCPAVPA